MRTSAVSILVQVLGTSGMCKEAEDSGLWPAYPTVIPAGPAVPGSCRHVPLHHSHEVCAEFRVALLRLWCKCSKTIKTEEIVAMERSLWREKKTRKGCRSLICRKMNTSLEGLIID